MADKGSLPVRLGGVSEEVTLRYHIFKFTDPQPVRLGEWQEPQLTRVVEAAAEAPELVPFPEELVDETDPVKREAMLEALNKNEWILKEGDGSKKTYLGKRLASPGNFALLVKRGDGYTLVPVHEWFEFQKRSSVKAMNIDQAEAHLLELSRKSVQQAMVMNQRLAHDKLAAEAAVVEAKRAIANKIADDEEQRDLRGVAIKGEAIEDGMEFEFEWSDDDEAAEVMVLANESVATLKEKQKALPEGVEENPLAPKMLTKEEKLAKQLDAMNKEYEKQQEQERLRKQGIKTEEEERKRPRDDASPEDAVAPNAEEGVKKIKKEVIKLPLNEEELIRVLRENPNLTAPELLALFKASFEDSVEKKAKFMRMMKKLVIQKTVAGRKVLRLKEGF